MQPGPFVPKAKLEPMLAELAAAMEEASVAAIKAPLGRVVENYRPTQYDMSGVEPRRRCDCGLDGERLPAECRWLRREARAAPGRRTQNEIFIDARGDHRGDRLQRSDALVSRLTDAAGCSCR